MPRPKGHRLSQATKHLISLRTRATMARRRAAACPHCKKPVDRWTLQKAAPVARPSLTPEDLRRLEATREQYVASAKGMLVVDPTEMENDVLWLLSILDPVDSPPDLTVVRDAPVGVVAPKKTKFVLKKMPPRLTPEPTSRWYALYRISPEDRKAIRQDVPPTRSLAEALVALKAAQEDGYAYQVHWSDKWPPSSIEYPMYVEHIVES